MTLWTLKTLRAHSLINSWTLETLRESILGSWECCAHSLVSAGINSQKFYSQLRIVSLFSFLSWIYFGDAQIQCPQNRYTDIKIGLDQGLCVRGYKDNYGNKVVKHVFCYHNHIFFVCSSIAMCGFFIFGKLQ